MDHSPGLACTARGFHQLIIRIICKPRHYLHGMYDPATTKARHLRFIRRWLAFFMAAMVFSGITAVPLEWGSRVMADLTASWGAPWPAWTSTVAAAIAAIGEHYPMIFYGTDWLAFAHLVIALAFIGPYRDPVRNRWVVEWGLWSCFGVILLAFQWAPVRGIPFFWRCIDAAFGVIGAIPLWLVLRHTERLARLEQASGPNT